MLEHIYTQYILMQKAILQNVNTPVNKTPKPNDEKNGNKYKCFLAASATLGWQPFGYIVCFG